MTDYIVYGLPVRELITLPENYKGYEPELNTVMEKIYRASGLPRYAMWEPEFDRCERFLIWWAMNDLREKLTEDGIV